MRLCDSVTQFYLSHVESILRYTDTEFLFRNNMVVVGMLKIILYGLQGCHLFSICALPDNPQILIMHVWIISQENVPSKHPTIDVLLLF